MRTESILIVDDEKLIRWSLLERLGQEGYRTEEADRGATAREALKGSDFDLVILDYRLPDTDGLTLLEEIRDSFTDLPVILITAFSSVEGAVRAMKLGAFDYINKPFDMDELVLVVQKALETTRLRREVRWLKENHARQFGSTEIVGVSPRMREVFHIIERVATTDATTVLLRGESGTGKGLVAKAIHQSSKRRDRPFMTVTCTALQETLLESELMGHEKGAFTDAKDQKKGLFELADGGTIFLDEIGDIPPSFQAKLLHVLEDKTFKRVGGVRDITVDVRIIAATNKDLEKAVRAGMFRQDLYYRLKIIPIQLPPLCERQGDIPLLVPLFIEHFNQEFGKSMKGTTPEALAIMEQYHWPGNIRELRNIVERAILLGQENVLGVEDLPSEIRDRSGGEPASAEGIFSLPSGGVVLEHLEKDLVRQALERSGGNQTHAAKLLGLNRDQIRYRIEKFGLRPARDRST
ncbi:MAG: sigma-54-dependent transcriptional regulator [Planctomycetota bacterium]